jgi:hypothetical protein
MVKKHNKVFYNEKGDTQFGFVIERSKLNKNTIGIWNPNKSFGGIKMPNVWIGEKKLRRKR